MIKITYHKKGSWTVLERKLALPLAEISLWWAETVRTRVGSTGIGSRGPFRAYVSRGKKPLWVPPGKPHPLAEQFEVKVGPYKGWAKYPNYKTYLQLSRKFGSPRTFLESGDLWDSLRVQMVSAHHAQIKFTGSNKNGLRRDRLLRELLRWETQGLLAVTPAEWAAIGRMLRERCGELWFEAARVAGDTMAIRRATAMAQGRAAKVVRRLSAVR